jgi:tetratricopeptide (TPR) repeat protein
MKRTVFVIALFIAYAFIAHGPIAQTTPTQPSPKMIAASTLYQQQKFAESAAAFGDVTKEEPKNGRAWYLMAMSYHSLGKYQEAIAAFEKNLGINAQNANAMYNIACGYARLGRADKAFEWLEKALAANGQVLKGFEKDADLESIRGDARFATLRDKVDRVVRPCQYSEQARQLDFWIGKWDVLTVQGQKAGVNIIEPFADGCSLMENWTAMNGGNGKSINYYDASTQKWYQHWIGSGGGALRYEGVFKDGAMRYEGETIANGVKSHHRLTFSKNDDGSVRQFAEISTDGGKTWNVSYDFKYVKAK